MIWNIRLQNNTEMYTMQYFVGVVLLDYTMSSVANEMHAMNH